MISFALVLLITLSVSLVKALNTQPYIGIYTEPSLYDNEGYPASQYSYIAASYVKFIEMAGARVVPILYDGDQEYYDNLMSQVNGILFPGGSVDIEKGTPFTDNAQYIFKKAQQLTNNGVYFPLWGTCLGFELLVNLSNDLEDALSHIDDEAGVDHYISVQKKGTLYSEMPAQLLLNAQVLDISFFNHEYCLLTETYKSNSKINSFFQLLATAENDKGVEFVAAVEANHYPIYGIQFHPEKANFEWKVQANHTLYGVMNSQYYADFFVQECRHNNNAFVSEEEANNQVIYNYTPVQVPSSSFEQIYFFENFQSKVQKQQEQEEIAEVTGIEQKIQDIFEEIFSYRKQIPKVFRDYE